MRPSAPDLCTYGLDDEQLRHPAMTASIGQRDVATDTARKADAAPVSTLSALPGLHADGASSLAGIGVAGLAFPARGGQISGAQISGAPVIRRSLSSVKQFEAMTDEGMLTRQGSSQKALVPLLRKYHDQFSGKDAKGRAGVQIDKVPEAISALMEMSDIVAWWIEDHTVDRDNGMGGVETLRDPSRVKRMAGMRTFDAQVQAEIVRLRTYQTSKALPVTVDILEPSPGHVKLKKRQTEGAQTMFAALGAVADQMVSDEGDTTELEVFVQFPVDPTGIGFIGGRLKGTVAKEDGFVKVSIEMALTGGAKVADSAQVAGELGGYFTAQAKTGEAAFLALSYGFYRRMRESAIIPAEMSSMIWGGKNAGAYGAAKSDDWSLKAEKKLWGGAADAAAGDKTYIETGTQAAVRGTAKFGAGSAGATAEGLLSGKEGRRADFTSLKNRKGGAGKQNLPSDSLIAQGTRALTGGTRGAEKHTSRSVRSVQATGTITVDIPLIAAVYGKGEFKVEMMNDGKRESMGEESKTTVTSAELKFTVAAGLKLRQLTGPALSMLIDRGTKGMTDLLRAKMLDLPGTDMGELAAGKAAVEATEALASQMGGVEKLIEDALAASVKESTGQVLKALSSVGAALVFIIDPIKDKASIELKLEDTTSLEIPTLLKAKLKRQKRVIRLTRTKGAWSAAQ
jgi:hypothetical protein